MLRAQPAPRAAAPSRRREEVTPLAPGSLVARAESGRELVGPLVGSGLGSGCSPKISALRLLSFFYFLRADRPMPAIFDLEIARPESDDRGAEAAEAAASDHEVGTSRRRLLNILFPGRECSPRRRLRPHSASVPALGAQGLRRREKS